VVAAGLARFLKLAGGIAKEFRGKGYATEAARGIDRLGVSRPSRSSGSCTASIAKTTASQAVARRLGARPERDIELFGHAAELWVTRREAWTGSKN